MVTIIKPQYGGLTRVYYGTLTAQQEIADPVVAPPDALATLSAEAAANATSLAFTSLTAPIARGNLLRFFPAAQVTTITIDNVSGEAKGETTLTTDALSANIPKGATLVGLNREFEITVTAAASSSATSLSVEPLKEALADGATLYYFTGTPKFAYTTADAEVGASAVSVQVLQETIASGAIALHKGLILLQGGTSTGDAVNTDSEENFVFGNTRGYSVSSPTGAGWEIPYEALALDLEPGFYRLKYAATQSVGGVLGYVRKRDPAPTGYVYGETTEGVCALYGFDKSNPADGNVTFTTTFTGQGAPTNTPPAL